MMKNLHPSSSEDIAGRFARRVAARLDEGAEALPHDIGHGTVGACLGWRTFRDASVPGGTAAGKEESEGDPAWRRACGL